MAKQRVERRLTAILAADVAGYSRLMGLDEAGTARRLRDHLAAVRPIVGEHDGRIVKTGRRHGLIPSMVAAVECAIKYKAMARRNARLPGRYASASASIGEVWSRAMTFWAMASMSRRGRRNCEPGGSACAFRLRSGQGQGRRPIHRWVSSA
jgi:class 3 adenylate cyclase